MVAPKGSGASHGYTQWSFACDLAASFLSFALDGFQAATIEL
jgi:hypothetical protein